MRTITCTDDYSFNPEVECMLQALKSRSNKYVTDHIHEMKSHEEKASEFMDKYYVGYGHESIGQCASTTIHFERVSILAAKAIQNNRLYNGQETSSRYIDFSDQPFYDFTGGNSVYKRITKGWLELYSLVNERMVEIYSKLNPIREGQNPIVWKKAIRAKAFDVARGYLPCNVATNLSWHGTLSDFYKNIVRLRYNPLREVQDISYELLDVLKQRYPSSFNRSPNKEQHSFISKFGSKCEYDTFDHTPSSQYLPSSVKDNSSDKIFRGRKNIFKTPLIYAPIPMDWEYLKERPKGIQIPNSFDRFTNLSVYFDLDYGSFRDLQRHRSCTIAFPLIRDKYGYYRWYYESLVDDDLKREVLEKVIHLRKMTAELLVNFKIDEYHAQYLFPMMTNVLADITGGISSLVYISELRSSKSVHPTLRNRAIQIGDWLQDLFPDIKLYIDREPCDFYYRRGEQDIVKKD